MMKFKFAEGAIIVGQPIYNIEDYAFDFQGLPPGSGQSLMMNTLQLAFELSQLRILYAWGYNPYVNWKLMKSPTPIFKSGQLFFEFDSEDKNDLFPGVGFDIKKDFEWPIYININSGWVCIGDPEAKSHTEAVEFATDTIAVLDNGELEALWIKPKNLLEDFKKKDVEINE